MLKFIKSIFGSGTDFKILMNQGAIIVDVRSPDEYKSGHISGAINIPVDKIGAQAESLKKKGKPVITCCRSGARSGMAESILKQKGVDAFNGGPWNSLQEKLKN